MGALCGRHLLPRARGHVRRWRPAGGTRSQSGAAYQATWRGRGRAHPSDTLRSEEADVAAEQGAASREH
eukprot:3131147-Pyramimonas_sp.AAC.1